MPAAWRCSGVAASCWPPRCWPGRCCGCAKRRRWATRWRWPGWPVRCWWRCGGAGRTGTRWNAAAAAHRRASPPARPRTPPPGAACCWARCRCSCCWPAGCCWAGRACWPATPACSPASPTRCCCRWPTSPCSRWRRPSPCTACRWWKWRGAPKRPHRPKICSPASRPSRRCRPRTRPARPRSLPAWAGNCTRPRGWGGSSARWRCWPPAPTRMRRRSRMRATAAACRCWPRCCRTCACCAR